MTSYLAAVAIILVLLVGWVLVQHLAQRAAARHPELGAYREYGRGCGTCGCGKGTCAESEDDGAIR